MQYEKQQRLHVHVEQGSAKRVLWEVAESKRLIRIHIEHWRSAAAGLLKAPACLVTDCRPVAMALYLSCQAILVCQLFQQQISDIHEEMSSMARLLTHLHLQWCPHP